MSRHYPGLAPIDAYGRGGFGFAGMSHRGALLVLPSGIHAWSPDPAALTVADFTLVLAEAAAIDLVIIGMGHAMARPPHAVRAALAAAGLQHDAMATGHAVATYNLLLGEKRRVAAALLPVHHAP